MKRHNHGRKVKAKLNTLVHKVKLMVITNPFNGLPQQIKTPNPNSDKFWTYHPTKGYRKNRL